MKAAKVGSIFHCNCFSLPVCLLFYRKYKMAACEWNEIMVSFFGHFFAVLCFKCTIACYRRVAALLRCGTSHKLRPSSWRGHTYNASVVQQKVRYKKTIITLLYYIIYDMYYYVFMMIWKKLSCWMTYCVAYRRLESKILKSCVSLLILLTKGLSRVSSIMSCCLSVITFIIRHRSASSVRKSCALKFNSTCESLVLLQRICLFCLCSAFCTKHGFKMKNEKRKMIKYAKRLRRLWDKRLSIKFSWKCDSAVDMNGHRARWVPFVRFLRLSSSISLHHPGTSRLLSSQQPNSAHQPAYCDVHPILSPHYHRKRVWRVWSKHFLRVSTCEWKGLAD